MINNKLQKEIISHIFNVFCIFKSKCNVIENILDEKYIINIMVADIKEEIEEFILIIKMDDLPFHALRLSKDTDDFGAFCLNIDDNKWINAGTAIQAKVLSGIE